MMHFGWGKKEKGEYILEVLYTGSRLLHSPIYNKGTGFTAEERRIFELEGLLPRAVSEIDDQEKRVFGNITFSDHPLQQYVALAALQDRNETLFYRVLTRNLERFLPIVYTPTVGKACQEYSQIFRRGRGLWITPEHRGRIKDVLRNAPHDDVRLIVVTDNERILGLGDQGAGGMGIPIGKLSLYTAAAGIHPSLTLPISLDVGTDNQKLLGDPLYLGCRGPRLRGEDYESLVHEFVEAVIEVFPKALLQWEDFKKKNAFDLLDRFRNKLCSFNDDIQGTAAVTVAGVVASGRISGTPLEDQRFLIAGAGAAGVGIGRHLHAALRAKGLNGSELICRIAMLDSSGLLVEGPRITEEHKWPFAWPAELAGSMGLSDGDGLETVVKAYKPTILLGITGQQGMFTESVCKEMAAHVARPGIFPLSNPTSKSEAVPEDLMRWTQGKALVATGSPFDPIERDGKTFCFGQCNNAYIFPGVGLGALVAEATAVSDEMFMTAGEILAELIEPEDLNCGRLFPPINELRDVAREIAIGVVRVARDSGLGRKIDDAQIAEEVDAFMWKPTYPRYVSAPR